MLDITDGIIESAQKVVIYAPEGLGKTSFAATFPKPLFDDTEGSTKKLNVKRLHKGEPPSSWTMLLNDIADIKSNPQICDTFIIDTIDWAEPMCKEFICSKYQVGSIGDIDHGKGYVRLTEEFGRFLNQLSDLIELGINVVLVAHAWPRKFELPDEMGAFDRWEMKLEKRLTPLIKEWADMVLFGNYKTYVVGSGKDGKGTKKAQGGNRVIHTSHHPCWDAKNRHGLPEELSFNSPKDGWNQIKHCIPARIVKPVSNPQPRAEEVAQDLNEPEPAKTEPPKRDPKKDVDLAFSGIPKPLADLMLKDNVTVEEIQKAVSARGYFPADTPISNYPTEFINGWLVGLWDQVVKVIRENRKG